MTHFILDENIGYDLIPFLQKKGFAVDHVKKMGLTGTKNGDLYRVIEKKKSWFITKDKDFSVKAGFDKYRVGGFIVLNLADESTMNVKDKLDVVFKKLKNKFSEKKLVLVKDNQVIIY